MPGASLALYSPAGLPLLLVQGPYSEQRGALPVVPKLLCKLYPQRSCYGHIAVVLGMCVVVVVGGAI